MHVRAESVGHRRSETSEYTTKTRTRVGACGRREREERDARARGERQEGGGEGEDVREGGAGWDEGVYAGVV